MKIIYPDCASTVSADTFDADYPADNLLDNHPLKPWKASGTDVTGVITVVTTAVSVAGLFVGGSNASSGSVVVKDATETTTYETHALSAGYGRFFVKFNAAYTEILHILVTLTAPTGPVYAGILRAGSFLVDIPDPLYGLKMQRIDYSIKKELSNGGMYIFNREMPRQYDLSMTIPSADAKTLDALYWVNGSQPLAMLLSDNIGDDDQWGGFFHMIDPPSLTYDYLTHTNLGLTLKEAV